ncbi:hypothetical protein [Halonotius terrestris]|nr:hypothetical protein [Halonotius terrestris]
MVQSDSPYVFGHAPPAKARHDPEGRDLVIIDGKSMTYRHHRAQQ